MMLSHPIQLFQGGRDCPLLVHGSDRILKLEPGHSLKVAGQLGLFCGATGKSSFYLHASRALEAKIRQHGVSVVSHIQHQTTHPRCLVEKAQQGRRKPELSAYDSI